MKKDISSLRIALVTDYMTGFGGADRLLFSILKIFPNADIFTSIFNKKKYPTLTKRVNTTFLQKLSFLKRGVNFLAPLSFELLNLEGYDLIISLSAGPAKGIIPKIGQKHISYILTPPRHQWSFELNARASRFRGLYLFSSKIIAHLLRIWDISTLSRIDSIITISKYIQDKISKIYRRDSIVVYPGISKFWFENVSEKDMAKIRMKYSLPKNFLLTASRLYDHKRIDVLIEAVLKTKETLVIVGEGPDLKYLKKVSSNSSQIIFLGYVSDYELRILYQMASCFLFAAIEDYGYVPLEANASGTASLVYCEGGQVETTDIGRSGDVFKNSEDLAKKISKKVWKQYNYEDIVRNASKYTEEDSLKKLKTQITKQYEKK